MRLTALPAALALLLAANAFAQVPPDQETEHLVKEGETLGGIAHRAKVPRVLIAEANGLKPPYVVKVGQKLVIPRTRHHKVMKGETGFTISFTYGVPWPDIAVANGIDPDGPIKVGQKLLIPTVLPPPAAAASALAAQPASAAFAWPLKGPVRRGYTARGSRNHHDGLDIRAKAGTAVRAAAPGKVVFAGKEPTQFGNMVVVDHGNGWHSAYAFLSKVTVKGGDQVGQGERVGLVGSTGLAKGEELHFELRRNNQPVDPLSQLPRE